ncbi:MAG: glucose-6-phosphate isomerase [Bacilli bacterium]|jgi:glucose-6-phosphate isomerase|nr:glucose-6-phosphate isomerase [Bacilli bacterium]
MVKFYSVGRQFDDLDWSIVDQKAKDVAKMIADENGEGADFLGWENYASTLPEGEIKKIEEDAKKIRANYEALVVVGIGGSYLGARAVIDAINGLFPEDKFEIIYLGNTLSASYTYQVMRHLEKKRFAINVISKSGTTTEPSVAFRLLKDMMEKEFGHAYLKDAIYATTDKSRGSLVKESEIEGYDRFVIPDNIGGRFSVITPVGLLPIACAGINIRHFLKGVIDGESDYSNPDYHENPAYKYGATRYLLNVQKKFSSEMFVSYEPQNKMIEEWLKQLFDESEGKENQALLCSSGIFTTDLHSMGQFIQQGTPCLFETIIRSEHSLHDVTVPYDDENLDNLNYLSGRSMAYINNKAYEATLDAHTSGHTPANIIEIDQMDSYALGNLMYFFFRACAFSAYLLGVNPFNQPGVEIYKSNMYKLLGKPEHK